MNNKCFVTLNMTTDSRDLNCVAFWHTPIWEKPELTAIQRHVTTSRINFSQPSLFGDVNTISVLHSAREFKLVLKEVYYPRVKLIVKVKLKYSKINK